MRFLEIQLTAFGPFTDKVIDLSEPGRSFHVIYGPNEAGKSTALRAITSLLYGIPRTTPDDHLHEAPKLLIGAQICDSQQNVLSFLRRKGNKNTLLDSARNPLDDRALDPYLGGLTMEAFLAMFGISHQSLLRGAAELKESTELGQLLFEAGTGIIGLRQLMQELEKEKDDLFRPRAQSLRINAAISDYEAANHQISELAYRAKEWARLDADLKRYESNLERLSQELTETAAELERLGRYSRAIPRVAERQQILGRLDALGEVSVLSPDAPADRVEAQRTIADRSASLDKATIRIRELTSQLEALPEREPILDEEETLETLHERLGEIKKAARDLPDVRAKEEQSRREAEAILREIRPDLALDQVDTIRLTAPQRSAIQKLAKEFPALEERQRAAEEAVLGADLELQTAKQKLDDMEAPLDTTPLELALAEAERQGPIEEQFRSTSLAIGTDEQEAATQLAALALWDGTLPELEALPVPSAETVDEHREKLAGLQSKIDDNRKRIKEAEEERAANQSRLADLEQAGRVPSAGDLEAARSRRNEGWHLVRSEWLEGGADPNELQAFGGRSSLPEAYEGSISEADQVADLLRSESVRVTTKEQLAAADAQIARKLDVLREEEQQLCKRLGAVEEGWRRMWEPLGIAPLSPREMQAWLVKRGELVALSSGLRGRRIQADDLGKRIEEHGAAIGRALDGLGLPANQPDEAFAALKARGREILARLTETAASRKAVASEVERLRASIAKGNTAREAADRDLAKWHRKWADATAPLGLGYSMEASAAEAILASLADLFNKLETAAERGGRVQAMMKDAEAFGADVAAIAKRLAPKLAKLPAQEAAAGLYAALNKARKDAERCQAFTKELEGLRRNAVDLQVEIESAQQKLQEMMAHAGCEDPAALEEAERRSRQYLELCEDRDRIEKQLAEDCAGQSVEELVKAVQELDADRLPLGIEEANSRIQALKDEQASLNQEIGAVREKLNVADGSAKAAEAAGEAQLCLSEIRRGVDRYVRLHLASQILRREIETYRQQNQDPLLRRAGEIFASLTDGSFAGVRVSFGDNDEPLIVGLRPVGTELTTEQMSDGARDQLFLSLRLASVEKQLAAGEPIPLIVDDILISFDDKRSRAALGVLSDLSEKTQILFFTHHSRLVELAKKAVSKDRLAVHDLA